MSYDDHRINRARLIERLLASMLNASMIAAFMVLIKVLGL